MIFIKQAFDIDLHDMHGMPSRVEILSAYAHVDSEHINTATKIREELFN